jgi:hypothetical protein
MRSQAKPTGLRRLRGEQETRGVGGRLLREVPLQDRMGAPGPSWLSRLGRMHGFGWEWARGLIRLQLIRWIRAGGSWFNHTLRRDVQ